MASSAQLRPYVVLTIEEAASIESEDVLRNNWEHRQVRVLGVVRKRHLQDSRVVLESDGEDALSVIEVDFSLIHDKAGAFDVGNRVHVFGEIRPGGLIQAHIVRPVRGLKDASKFHRLHADPAYNKLKQSNLKKREFETAVNVEEDAELLECYQVESEGANKSDVDLFED